MAAGRTSRTKVTRERRQPVKRQMQKVPRCMGCGGQRGLRRVGRAIFCATCAGGTTDKKD